MLLARTMATVGVLAVLLAGCTATDRGVNSCGEPQHEAVVRNQPDLDQVGQDEANLVVHVTSSLQESVRVTLSVDNAVALDVEVPGTTPGCSGVPVYVYRYRLPEGPATVTGQTGDGQRRATTVELGSDPRWIVVSVQKGFPLSVDVWEEEPNWG
jgi:hypothetical protein